MVKANKNERVIELARAGRKRKQGRRKPSGRLATPGEKERVDAAKSTALTQRYKRDVLNRRDHQEHEGMLGHAFVLGMVDEYQRKAGDDYNHLVRRYAGLKGIPLPTPKGQRFDREYGSSLKPEIDDDKMREIESDYMAAVGALKVVGYGSAAIREVNAVCVYGREVTDPHGLRLGLEALVDLWHFREETLGNAPMSLKIKKWKTMDAKPQERDDIRRDTAKQAG